MKGTLPATFVLGLVVCLTSFGSLPALHAQATGRDLSAAGSENAIGDQEIKAFARAYVRFHKIRAAYEPKLNGAVSPQEKGRVEQEAVTKFGAVLEREGLSMERYAALFQTISADQELREKTLKLIEEERAKS